MRTFVLGDIHGAYGALVQCLERSGFRREEDRLVALGDVCDVYPQTAQCIEELLSVKNLYYLIGNHDLWALEWALGGVQSKTWLAHGGEATIQSYHGQPVPDKHIDLLNKAQLFLELDGRLFVHAGFDPLSPIKDQGVRVLAWDRSLVLLAHAAYLSGKTNCFGNYKDIFVGHTPTQQFGYEVPVRFANLWLLDTGAGWSGRLAIMDVETKECWQSDQVNKIYGVKGRG